MTTLTDSRPLTKTPTPVTLTTSEPRALIPPAPGSVASPRPSSYPPGEPSLHRRARGRDSVAGSLPLMEHAALAGALALQDAATRSYGLFLRAATLPPGAAERLGPAAALRAALHAARHVPAYHAFLAEAAWRDQPDAPTPARLARLPIMDKESYVRRYSIEERCLDGALPRAGLQIDESSGSSGTAFNWVRGAAESREMRRTMALFARYLCGDGAIAINAFSMGAWATGVSTGEALRRHCIVKSTGPDVEKVLDTMRAFGPRYPYVLTGYPPFLKSLVDEGERAGFPWADYRVRALVGGEGMGEGLRAHLERRLDVVYSGYGASDLEMGVAGESPFTVWLRRRVAADDGLRRALFGDAECLPMIFQYNPLTHYVEATPGGELVVTINRLSVVSPRVRYNIHDAGGVVPFARVARLLQARRLDPHACVAPGQPLLRFPLLYLYGRSDDTVSYMGANIYPRDVEDALYDDGSDAARITGYCLALHAQDGEERPCVHVEVRGGPHDDPEMAGRLAARIVRHLANVNRDFRNALAENPATGQLAVRLHAAGEGPFAGDAGRIKRRRVVRERGTTL